MDLWLCGKFCPSFEVRRSGGEEERFASGACSCVMGCYWEFSPTHWDTNNSLVSLISDLTELEKLLTTFFFVLCILYTRYISEISHSRKHSCSIALFLVFMSSRLTINICCSPAWLTDDIYWKIDACFLQYCSNFLLSHGGTQTDTGRHSTCYPGPLFKK